MANQPLADKLRPTSFDEVVGQTHLVGTNGIVRKLVENGRIPNMIFFGPPGTGKTTVANIIAASSGMQLYKLNATTAGLAVSRAFLALFPRRRKHLSRIIPLRFATTSRASYFIRVNTHQLVKFFTTFRTFILQ